MTAEQIYMLAKEQMPCIAIGTIYRNLGIMERDGEILCSRCGTLEDIWMEGLLEIMNSMTEMQIESYELALHGVCKKCQKSAAAAD